MSPEVLLEQKLQVDSGLFVALSAFEGYNFWGKLEDKHRVLFLEGFDAVDPGMLYPACRHHFSPVHVNDYYYNKYFKIFSYFTFTVMLLLLVLFLFIYFILFSFFLVNINAMLFIEISIRLVVRDYC